MLKHVAIAFDRRFSKGTISGKVLIELCLRRASRLYILHISQIVSSSNSYLCTNVIEDTLRVPTHYSSLTHIQPITRICVLNLAIYSIRLTSISREYGLRSNVFQKLVGLLISPDFTTRFVFYNQRTKGISVDRLTISSHVAVSKNVCIRPGACEQ